MQTLKRVNFENSAFGGRWVYWVENSGFVVWDDPFAQVKGRTLLISARIEEFPISTLPQSLRTKISHVTYNNVIG